ncbi:MAG: hypothetical protein KAS28_04655 [Desulfobacula sp.]|nr:hypothetical protein [Desulfobacula sp.]
MMKGFIMEFFFLRFNVYLSRVVIPTIPSRNWQLTEYKKQLLRSDIEHL